MIKDAYICKYKIHFTSMKTYSKRLEDIIMSSQFC